MFTKLYIKIIRYYCVTSNFFPNKVLSIKEIREKIIDWVKPQRSWSLEPPPTYTENIQYLNPKSQQDLPIRKMMDSYSTAILPLGEDVTLRDNYILSDKKIRTGRLLEDLDAFAVWIGYKHNQRPGLVPGKVPFNMVTALVDKITLVDYAPSSDCNIKFSGMTTWVGSTSLEITMQLEQHVSINGKPVGMVSNNRFQQSFHPLNQSSIVPGNWLPILECKFLMVARDRNNPAGKGVYVNPLIQPQQMSNLEQDLYNLGVENNKRRQKSSEFSLLKCAPNETERQLMHQLFMETIDPLAGTFKNRQLPDKCVWMQDTLVKNVIICQPQERNLNNTIFGGFLMRQAYELSWVTAYSYMKTRPKILRIEDIVFKRAVHVGAILYLSGQVVFTSGKNVMVKVHSEIKDLKSGELFTCNILHLLFQPANIPINDELPIPAREWRMPPKVMPYTYSDMMLYIMGKRHFLNEI